jgi:hypothetical protein
MKISTNKTKAIGSGRETNTRVKGSITGQVNSFVYCIWDVICRYKRYSRLCLIIHHGMMYVGVEV